MWWAVYITIIIGRQHQTIIPPQAFSNYGDCQQFADKLAEMPLPSKKATIKIKCGDALGGG